VVAGLQTLLEMSWATGGCRGVAGLIGGRLGRGVSPESFEPCWRRVTGVEWAPLEGKQAAVGWPSGGGGRMCLIGGELDAGRGKWRVAGEKWIAVEGESGKGLCE
jgi:hypothetical protein